MIQESKFLGGDMEHTHLVKGLDFALLQKVSTDIVMLLFYPVRSHRQRGWAEGSSCHLRVLQSCQCGFLFLGKIYEGLGSWWKWAYWF